MADTEEQQQQPQENTEQTPPRSDEAPAQQQAKLGGGGGRGDRGTGDRGGNRGQQRPPGGGPPRADRGEQRGGGDRERDQRPSGGDRGGRPGRDRFDGPPEIELEKLMTDSLYLDNQAHAVVARMRDMDSGTRSQLRRFYSAVRRAVRTPDTEKQHEFVMLRARLAYTIARHQLRSLDPLEKLLLQVTRRNDNRGYERFRDLFEAIVAYNE